MTAENPQHRINPDVLPTAEKPLAGKTAIVTGGSRDVGAAIVQSLAKEGVRVVFSYNNKPKRAEEVLSAVSSTGGEAHGIAADISTPEGRASFFTSTIDILGDRLDFLILSTSGPTPELNEIASNDFLDRALPHMREGGRFMRMQSVPGHYMPQLRGSFSLKEYNNVAESKYPDLKSLRKRIPEMKERGVRFTEVCPPIVTGTNNVRFAHRIDPTAEAQHNIVTDRLGLPRAVTPEQVGLKIAELLKNPEIRSGYTEFFNGLVDAQTELEELYDDVYVNTFELDGKINETRYGSGRTIIALEQATRQDEPLMVDRLRLNGNRSYEGVLAVGQEHAKGRTPDERNHQPIIFPEHKQIRSAVETIGMLRRARGETTESIRLAGFVRAEFFMPIIINGKSGLVIIPRENEDGTFDVEILDKQTGEKYAFIEGVKVRIADEAERDNLLEDQMLMGAFQSTLLSNGNLRTRNCPRVLELGQTEFMGVGIAKGEGIKYEVATESQNDQGRYKATVAIYSQGRKIGMVNGLVCG